MTPTQLTEIITALPTYAGITALMGRIKITQAAAGTQAGAQEREETDDGTQETAG
jgi:hypothetical protein